MGDSKGLDAPLTLWQRLSKIMRDVSYVCKEDKKVNNQYKFVSHDAVTAKIRTALVKHGVLSIPTVTETNQDGNRTSVMVRMDFINVDNPSEKISVDYVGYGIDTQDKGPGKAISYAVKYAYLKVFALETGDDPEREQIEYKPYLKPILESIDEIKNSPTQEESKKLATHYYKMYGDKTEKDMIKKAFEGTKKALKNPRKEAINVDVPQ